MTEPAHQTTRYTGLFRRLFAIFYDMFLLIAIILTVIAITMIFNHGEAIEPSGTFNPLFIFVIVPISYLYFAWFWIHGGQTLGMKTWHIRIRREDDSVIDWKIAGIRFISAILSWCAAGLGYLWALFDGKNRCWHDIASKTVLVDLRLRK